MKVVHKFKWYDEVKLPKGAEIIHAAFQDEDDPNSLNLWAVVDKDENEFEDRKLVLLPTGNIGVTNEEYKNMKHINTVLVNGGTYVWHLFEVKK